MAKLKKTTVIKDIANYVVFSGKEKKISFEDGQSILDLALANRMDLSHSCGGMGSCGTCRVFVESPLEDLQPRNEIEQEMADSRGFSDHERLACQTAACPGLIIRIPKK